MHNGADVNADAASVNVDAASVNLTSGEQEAALLAALVFKDVPFWAYRFDTRYWN
jgi:hypothetical protein